MAGFLYLRSLRIGVLALDRILTEIIPPQMAILTTGAILTRIDQIIITNAAREVTLVTLKITDLVDLIINKDRRTTITTPLGETGIGKIITLKTEGFIHKKVDRKALPWIETQNARFHPQENWTNAYSPQGNPGRRGEDSLPQSSTPLHTQPENSVG